jgi:hypothetical protein
MEALVAKPADKHRLEAGLLDNQRGEHIVSPEAADDAGLLQQFTESFGPALGLMRLLVSLSSYFVPPRIFEFHRLFLHDPFTHLIGKPEGGAILGAGGFDSLTVHHIDCE